MLNAYIKEFVLFPMPIWVAVLVGLWCLARERQRLGYGALALAGLLWWLSVTPLVVYTLASHWQVHTDPRLQPKGAEAVVVLGAGAVYRNGYHLNQEGWQRLQEAVWIAHQYHLPLIISDGVRYRRWTGAQLMARAARNRLLTEPSMLEEQSTNTHENARFTARLLRLKSIHRVILVSSALHLPRAAAEFRAAGVAVVLDGVDEVTPHALSWEDVLPSEEAYALARSLEHEWLAWGLYRLHTRLHGQ
jgi:uncharacterized SAM-binding protein YcdF (DUF218 family)